MDKKGLNLFQMFYLIIGGICAVEAIFGLIFRGGNLNILLQGVVYIALALFFVTLVSGDKLEANSSEREVFSDSLKDTIQKNELTSIVTKLDFSVAIIYVALRAYFALGINIIIAKIPLINLVNTVLSSINGILFYLFLIALVSMYASKNFNKLAMALGGYVAVSAFYLLKGLFNYTFNGFGAFSNVVPLMFFGYVLCIFYPYLGAKDISSEQ